MKEQALAEIEFEISEEALSAFNEHHARYVPKIKKATERHRILWPIGIILLAGYAWYRDGEPFFVAGMVVTALIWSLYVPRALKDIYRKSVRREYSEQAKKELYGTHKMQIKESALVEYSPAGRASIEWSKLMRVDEVKDYAFVYIDTNTALIIPKDPVDENISAFINMIKGRIDDGW